MAKKKDVWIKTGYKLDRIMNNMEFFNLIKEHPEYFKDAETSNQWHSNGIIELGNLKSIRIESNISIFYTPKDCKYGNYQSSRAFYLTDKIDVDQNGVTFENRFKILFNKNLIRGLKLEDIDIL